MTIQFACECGHPLEAPEAHAGHRLRCPECQVAVVIPNQSVEPIVYETSKTLETTTADSNPDVLHGGSAFTIGTWLIPLFFGKSELRLEADRLIEVSCRPVTRHHRAVLLEDVTAAGVSVIGNPMLLVFGLLLLPANGAGLVLLIPWVFLRHRVVFIHGVRTSHAITVAKRDEQAGQEFAYRVLDRGRADGRN